MPMYRVTALAPAEIYEHVVKPNDLIQLSEAQAQTLLIKSQIVLDGTALPISPEIAPIFQGDELMLRRGNLLLSITVDQLGAYFAGLAPAVPSISLSSTIFTTGTAQGAILASIVQPAGWTTVAETTFSGNVAVVGANLVAAKVLGTAATGQARLRSTSADGLQNVVKTFDLEIKAAIVQPVPPVILRPVGAVSGLLHGLPVSYALAA
jgi:hypothetical protein